MRVFIHVHGHVYDALKIDEQAGDIPVGDAAPGSHGHTAATAATAFSVRIPRVPVIHTGHLDTRQQFRKHNINSCQLMVFWPNLIQFQGCFFSSEAATFLKVKNELGNSVFLKATWTRNPQSGQKK